MSKSRTFISICVFFALGVFFASVKQVDLRVVYLLAVFVTIGLTWFIVKGFGLGVWLGLLLLVGLFGAARFQTQISESEFLKLFENKTELIGVISEEPDLRETRQLLNFRPENFNQEILITTTKGIEYNYGDKVVVMGKVKEPKSFDDFDYKGYLERYNVYAVVSYPKILVIKTNQGNPIKSKILEVKVWFMKRTTKLFKPTEGNLLLGILIGAKRGMSQKTTDQFNTVGLSHIVAVSGYNISIIIGSLSFLAYLFGRRVSFWFSLLIILSFVVLTGASASVIRAATMGLVLLLAYRLGRPYSVGPAICLAGAVMIFINPKILFWDVGFQLSFLATLGIVYGMPVLTERFKNWPDLFKLKEIFFTTICALATTLPLTMYYFNQFGSYAILVNLLVLPLIPTIMTLGFLTMLPFLAPGFAFLCEKLLSLIIFIAEKFSDAPYSKLEFSPPIWAVLSMYVFILLIFVLLHTKKTKAYTKVDIG